MVEIRLKNSKSRKVEVLEPIIPGKVSMYLCGPTVYDRAHIGNARSAVVFDQLFRLLRHVYGADNVTFVRNFTDVDDKINARAAEEGRDITDLTAETSQWYMDDTRALGVLDPTHMPRATGYIPEMVAFIEDLIAKDFAYARDGHVLFRVRKSSEYGALSGRSVDDMIAGARVEVAPYKEDPMDFVLWKPSADDIPGWESPWGRGRPGWHIECSAMAHALLGEEFDIHAGGADLMFPHHENELAQSCAAGHKFARIWMHNEMLQVEGKKMSKSLGNFFTVRDLLDQGVPGEVIRFVMLSTHYGKPMDWTEKKREEAEKTLKRWRRFSHAIDGGEVSADVLRALCDDLNTPLALTFCHNLFKIGDFSKLKASAEFLGILTNQLGDWEWEPVSDSAHGYGYVSKAGVNVTLQNLHLERVNNLISERAHAKTKGDFSAADNIRDQLQAAGIVLEDGPKVTSWKLGRTATIKKINGLLEAQK